MQEGSVVWMGWGRDIVLLGSMPHSWGSWALTQTPCKRNHGSGRFLLALSCDTLGKGDAGKVKLFLLPSPVRPNLYFWLQWYAGNLDLHKGSLVHGWLCKTVFSRGFWTMAKRGWSWFMGHCKVHRQDQGLLLITWCMDRWGASKVPWHMVLDHTAPTKALLPMDRCQIVVVERGYEWKTSYSAMLLTSLVTFYGSKMASSAPYFQQTQFGLCHRSKS